jgi:hypothetical protein
VATDVLKELPLSPSGFPDLFLEVRFYEMATQNYIFLRGKGPRIPRSTLGGVLPPRSHGAPHSFAHSETNSR